MVHSKDVFKHITHLREGFKPRTNIWRNKTGKFIGDVDRIKQEWKEYFKELLDNERQEQETEIPTYQMRKNTLNHQ